MKTIKSDKILSHIDEVWQQARGNPKSATGPTAAEFARRHGCPFKRALAQIAIALIWLTIAAALLFTSYRVGYQTGMDQTREFYTRWIYRANVHQHSVHPGERFDR